jgi:PAS domain S-box-containing protein
MFEKRSSWWARTTGIVAACGIVGILALRYFEPAVPAVARRPLRIGFEENPPVQIRTAEGFSGLSVETVSEAAKRAGIQLEWVETGRSSADSLRQGLVDLWPLVVDLPDRRQFIHFARPWMHSSYVLLFREGTQIGDRSVPGRIAVFRMPLHARLARERFPAAQVVETPAAHGVISQVCTGAAAAGFFEMRMAQSELRERPAECAGVVLRLHTLPNMTLQAGLASTFEAAGPADRIQREIANMFRDGSLAVLIAKYSYFGLDDTWASYEQIDEEKRRHWLIWLAIGAAFAAGIVVWQASSLRQRKRVESALRESEERFRSLANTVPVMIMAAGADGQATFFNKTWLDFTGRSLKEELGWGWVENLHQDDRDRAIHEQAASSAAQQACRVDFRLRRADGEYRHMMCTGVPHLEPNGVFAGYIASCVDLTDIESAQEEARERQNLESLGVLAGGIAHDFNNLLGGTLSYSELAQMKLDEGSTPEEELLKIREVAVRGCEIVRQLMIFSGKERGSVEALDVSSLVRDMLELLRVSISKNVVLKTNLRKGLPAVRGNPAQIRQVVMNLVINASEAIGDRNGVVRVETECVRVRPDSSLPGAKGMEEGNYLLLEVSDNGSGMTKEIQRKAFDPFFTTKFTGRGMGLAVVQQIVRGLGGGIHVASSPGNGTSIKVMLPCATEPISVKESRITARQHPEPRTQVQATRAILVVEDEEPLLFAVSKLLQRRGFRVIQASDGTSALALIRNRENHIDAMLLDFTLPGVSSREVLQEAKRLRPELLVILTSAYSRESVATSLAGLGFENFIRKPFQIEDLTVLLEGSPFMLPCGSPGSSETLISSQTIDPSTP